MHAEAIAELYEIRKQELGEDFARMRQIREVMDNELVLPLPELSSTEVPAVANLAQQGMSQLSRRIASVEPSFYFPSLSPGDTAADNRAQDRHRVTTGWWHDNKMKRRVGKRARHFLAYAVAPVLIKPNRKTGLPQWMVKDPLNCFPGEDTFENAVPPDCIFVTNHSYRSLLQLHGDTPEGLAAIRAVQKPSGWNFDNDVANYDTMFEVLEYVDDEEIHLILMGHSPADGYASISGPSAVTLAHAKNLAGRPLAIVPGSINLNKQLGHFDGIIGMYQTQAALMALTLVAQRRTVWPREWLVANPGENPEVITTPDPAHGQPGEMRGGRLETQNLDPSFRTLEAMDRLEGAQRMTAGLPAEFGGMSATNIRTGRRGAQVMGASIDFTIAEAQDIFASSLVEENKVAIAIDKAYFNRTKTYSIATRSFSGSVHYKPATLWDTDAHIVDYPIAGTDLQNLPIEGGQRVAMKTLSRKAFMEMDPVVRDVDAQLSQIEREGIGDAFITSIQTLAANPEGPYQPVHLARLDKKLASGKPLYEAIIELQEEIQKEQAEAAEEAAQTQPGLSMPGQGVEQPAAIPEGTQSMSNLTALLGQLGTAQTAQAYRPVG